MDIGAMVHTDQPDDDVVAAPGKADADSQEDPAASLARWKEYIYREELPDEELEPARKVLVEYSGVAPGDVETHIRRIRDVLFATHPYPCIGRFRFVVLPTSETDALFAAAAHRLRADSETHLLDVACCIGQVLRALHVLEGVPARQLAGTDLRQEFLDTGFDLWRDRERFEGDGAQLVAGDLLAEDDEPLKVLDGRFALVHAGSFFHLFDWPTQVRAARRIVRFLRPPPPPQPERPADSSSSPTSRTLPAIVFGRQLGSLKPEELPVLSAAARGRTSTRFLHDEASFQRLWNEVGAATDTRWQVHVEILDKLPPNMPSFNEHTRLIRFAAVRVEG